MCPDPARREDDGDDAALPMRRPKKHLRATSRVCVFLKQRDGFEEDDDEEDEEEAKTTPPLVVVVVVIVASILFSTVFSKGGGRVVVLVRSSSLSREKMGRSFQNPKY